jgi:transcriptional regulator with XRE-family HTH domain
MSLRLVEGGDPALGARIRAVREAAGLSRNDVASRAGISETYLHNLESGRFTRPSIQVVRGIADALSWHRILQDQRQVYALREELLGLAGHQQAAYFDGIIAQALSQRGEREQGAREVADKILRIRESDPEAAAALDLIVARLAGGDSQR